MNNRSVTIKTKMWGRGVTLPEMMIALAITVWMLLATGMVFKATTKATGKALAAGRLMQQALALTHQLDEDFRGFRPDLPMVIIYQDLNGRRHDRIVFYANGDFQTTDGLASGNVARIHYGNAMGSDGMMNNIFARRFKLYIPSMSAVLNPPGNLSAIEVSKLADAWQRDWHNPDSWETVPASVYAGTYFSERPDMPGSITRRTIIDPQQLDYNVQKSFMLPDVGEFRIAVWYNSGSNANVWVPDILLPNPDIGGAYYWGYYWNLPNMDSVLRDIGFRHQPKVPIALKFTFTLYDKGRRYYPHGMTFSYIVRLNTK